MPVPISPQTSGTTLAEKILARASGRDHVHAGEIITARLDLLMMHDSGGPRRVAARLQHLQAKVWDPDKVVVVSDHFVPAVDIESAEILALTRQWAKARNITHYDMLGICHVVLQEYGHVQPGMFCIGGDSHSPSGGAFGALMFGMGATDITGALVTGETWLRVPHSVDVQLEGALTPGVSAKDVMLMLCARHGMGNDGQVFHYSGSAVRAMPMHERMTLCNMSAELGADTGMIEPDAVTLAALNATRQPFSDKIAQWRSDADARWLHRHRYDVTGLAPQIAAPHSPANSAPVDAHTRVRIDQAYIGACTGAKLTDLQMAAKVLKGRKIARGTRLLIAPASAATTANASADGTLPTLLEAGAILLPSGCGACAGMGAGVLGGGEVCISTTARNFKGRMGSPGARVYLGSPYSVAAAAVKGEICDPREFIGEHA